MGILFYSVISTTAVSLMGLMVLRRWLYRPLTKMVKGIDRILEAGDWAHRLDIPSKDFGYVARAINTMTQSLHDMKREIDSPAASEAGPPSIRTE